MSSVTLKDFYPFNRWTPDENGSRWSDESPAYLIDQTTGKYYWNEDENCVGLKCFFLALGTPIVHPIASVLQGAIRIVRLVTLYHFRANKYDEKSYSLKNRALEAGGDILKIVTIPLSVIGLTLAAVYGIFLPYDGRKLYASIERAQYGSYVLAPCFQPDPTCHA